MKKLFKITAIVFGSLLLLCLLVGWLITAELGENVLRGWLEGQISAEMGLPVSIGRLETNLWSRIQLDTIIVLPSDGSGTEPMLFVGHLRIQYSIPNLLGDQTRLGFIEVDSLALALVFDSLGRSGIPLLDDPDPDTSESDELTPPIVIDSISLSRIGVGYNDTQLPLLTKAAGVKVSTSGRADGSHTGLMSVSNIDIAYDSLNLMASDIEIAATLIDEILHVEYLKADCHGLAIDASGDVSLSDSRELDLTVDIEGSIADIASVLNSAYGSFPVTAGFMMLDLGLQGTFDNPQVLLDGGFRDLVSPNLTVDSVSALAHYVDNEIDLTALHLGLLGGTIAVKGSAILDSVGVTQMEIALNGLALSEIWQGVYSEDSPYRGELSGTITAAGRGTDWESLVLGATLSGNNLRYNDKAIPDLLCQASIESGMAVLSLAHGADTIRSDLQIFTDSLEGEFTVKIPDLAALSRFIDEPDLAGEFQANGAISGLFTNPSLSVRISGSRISYRNFPVNILSGQLSYSDSQLTVLEFKCEGHLDSINTTPLFGIDSIGGAMTYQCQLSGPLNELQGRLTAGMVAPKYAHYSLDSVALEVLLDGSKINVTRLDASIYDVSARLTAAFDTTTKVGSFNVTLRPFNSIADAETEKAPELTPAGDLFGAIEGHFSLVSDSQLKASIHGNRLWLGLIPTLLNDTLQVEGHASFSLTLDGPYFAPNAELQARIQPLMIVDQRMDSIVISLSLNPEALTLDSLSFHALGQTLRASGRLDLTIAEDGFYAIQQDGALKADLSTTDFDLAVFEHFLLPEGEIAGVVSAMLQVTGPTSSPTFNGWFTLDKGWVLIAEDSPPLDSVAISLSFVDTVLTINSATSMISGIPIRANGSLITSRFESATADLAMSVGQFGRIGISGSFTDEDVQLEITLDTVNLAALEPFVPAIDSLAGRLSADIDVSGELSAPEFDGRLNITAAAFHSLGYNVNVVDGFADVRFDRSQVSIDSVSAALNGGRIILTGVISLDQGELIDVGLKARASRVRLEEPETYIVLIDSASLAYGRQKERYILDGDIVLGESRLIAGLRPSAILPWVQSIETVDMELPDLIARSHLDVRIRESDNLWVDNNLARIRLRAELGVIGTPLRPNFTGLVRIEEGYLLYLDRRFKVNEGLVYFTDPNRFNPDIKLDANTQITTYRRTTAESYTVYIQAEGLLDQLRFGLFSEPALDRPDIVALLTLGATRSELTKSSDDNSGSGLSQVLKDRAAMLTSQRVSGYVSRKAGAVFGFDEFSIQGNLFRFDDSWGPQLVASKRLSRTVDLTYSTTVGHLNDQSVRLGYRLTPRWSLMGETDRQGRSGLDLKYGIRFK